MVGFFLLCFVVVVFFFKPPERDFWMRYNSQREKNAWAGTVSLNSKIQSNWIPKHEKDKRALQNAEWDEEEATGWFPGKSTDKKGESPVDCSFLGSNSFVRTFYLAAVHSSSGHLRCWRGVRERAKCADEHCHTDVNLLLQKGADKRNYVAWKTEPGDFYRAGENVTNIDKRKAEKVSSPPLLVSRMKHPIHLFFFIWWEQTLGHWQWISGSNELPMIHMGIQALCSAVH